MNRSVNRRAKRRGAVFVLTAFLMVLLMALLAFSIDLGKLCVARSELQRTADAAAIAAAWELIDPLELTGSPAPSLAEARARQQAEQLAISNAVLLQSPQLSEQDVQFGYMADPTDAHSPFDTSGLYPFNAVRVVVRRTSEQNGVIPLSFARALGVDSSSMVAEATAAFLANIDGFAIPEDQSNLGILPIALDSETWVNLIRYGIGTDSWKWDEVQQRVLPGSDSIREINIYPQCTGAPGNRGTVDIGSPNNSTADIARQIVYGISPADLEYHGGKLQFNSNGELFLNGDTGISAGIKDELASIIGQKRIVPVFSGVTGPGNNATYTIVQFVGVRILEVKLTGSSSSKRVIVQPAHVITRGVIPGSVPGKSTFVYSPVRLVR